MRAAEEIFRDFREHSIAEFFKRNRHMLGYSGKIRSLTTVVHELVTNAIDACEEAWILPEVEVSIEKLGDEHYRVRVRDNGPGIPEDKIPLAFGKMLAGTKFHRFIQARGQQGIGASGVVLFGQITTGKPTRIVSGTGDGFVHEMYVMIDVYKNMPKVVRKKKERGYWHGTMVEVELKEVSYVRGEKSPYEYLRRTAIANPHVTIKFQEPSGEMVVFRRSSNELPGVAKEVKPHPWGVSVDDLLALARETKTRTIRGFLLKELSRVSARKVKEIESLCTFPFNKNPKKLSWKEAEEIVKAFRKVKFIAPSTEGLVPIGSEHIKRSLEAIVEPEKVFVAKRKPKIYRGGIPFLVEAAIAFGGKAGRRSNGVKSEIMRFANRAPLLFDTSACAITQAVKSINWKNYGIQNFEESPITVFVNVSSVFIPYVSAGKQAIAKVEEVYDEIRLALMECARGLKAHIARKRREEILKRKLMIFERYALEISHALAKLTGEDEKKVKEMLDELIRRRVGVESS